MEIILSIIGDWGFLSDWMYLYNWKFLIGIFTSPVVLTIITNYIYEAFKKRDSLVAEELIYNSLCKLIKNGKMPSTIFIKTLIKTTAKKYKLDIGDLPHPSYYIERLLTETVTNPLCSDDKMYNYHYQLEWLKLRFAEPCWKKIWYKYKQWIDRLLWALLIVLIWALFLIPTEVFFDLYIDSFLFLITFVLLIIAIGLYGITFCLSEAKNEEKSYDEIVNAWKIFRDKGTKNANKKKYDLAFKYYYQAIEIYPAIRTEEYDCFHRGAKDKYDDALDIGELYILHGGNIKNIGEERYDESLYYLQKGLDLLEKSDKMCKEIISERRIQLAKDAYYHFACIYAKLGNRTQFEKTMEKMREFDNNGQDSLFERLYDWLQTNAKEEYMEILEQIRNRVNRDDKEGDNS